MKLVPHKGIYLFAIKKRLFFNFKVGRCTINSAIMQSLLLNLFHRIAYLSTHVQHRNVHLFFRVTFFHLFNVFYTSYVIAMVRSNYSMSNRSGDTAIFTYLLAKYLNLHLFAKIWQLFIGLSNTFWTHVWILALWALRAWYLFIYTKLGKFSTFCKQISWFLCWMNSGFFDVLPLVLRFGPVS